MPKLKDITTVAENNDACVVLDVLPGHELDLIKLGCFDGDETRLRLTKGRDVTCTVFRDGRPPFSWNWGASGHTLVSPNVARIGRLVQECVERGLRIRCEK